MFARANCTRHLLCGGVFLRDGIQNTNIEAIEQRYDNNITHWVTAGSAPLTLATHSQSLIGAFIPDTCSLTTFKSG